MLSKIYDTFTITPVPVSQQTVVDLPSFQVADVIGIILASLLSFIGLPVYLLVFLTSIPWFFMIQIYIWTLPKPTIKIDRSSVTFQALRNVSFIVSIPWMTLALLNVTIIFLFTHLSTLPYGLIFVDIRENWHFIKTSRQSCKFNYTDLLVATIGGYNRQGPLEFISKYPIIFTLTPMLKYCFTCNMFLHDLDIVHTNQWTAGIKISSQKAADLIFRNISWSIHDEKGKEDLDEDQFCAHYPSYDTEMVIGLQFNFLVLLTNSAHRNGSELFKSRTGLFPIYQIHLHYFFPFHIFTGYVEVNLMTGGPTRIEHPLWCLLGPNYYSRKFYRNVNTLFFNKVATDTEGFILKILQDEEETE